MRKLVTVAATALTLGLMTFAAPAFADEYGRGNRDGQRQSDQYQGNQYDNQGDYKSQARKHGPKVDRGYDFGRQEGNFDRWENGWRPEIGQHRFGYHQQPLNYWQLVRRLERQGYYGVRGLRPAHNGRGWRAFAFVGRGMPVMLRINPYTGRVIDVRYI